MSPDADLAALTLLDLAVNLRPAVEDGDCAAVRRIVDRARQCLQVLASESGEAERCPDCGVPMTGAACGFCLTLTRAERNEIGGQS